MITTFLYENNYNSTLNAITEQGELTDEIIAELKKSVNEFKKAFIS